jgi:hypothetical protein
MDSEWLVAVGVAAAGALGGFIYWGSSALVARVQTFLRPR